MVLILKKNQNKKQRKTRKQRGEKTPHLFFNSGFDFILHSGGGSGFIIMMILVPWIWNYSCASLILVFLPYL